MINAERLKETFFRLLAIDSPSFHEHTLADAVASELRNMGFEVALEPVETPEGPSVNVRAFLRCGEPALLLSAHLDTVESTAGLRVMTDGSIVKSDGTTILGADDKAGVAVILEALRCCAEKRTLARSVEVLFTCGEERGLIGSRAADVSWVRAREGLILDGEGPVGTVVLAAPFHYRLTGRFKGKAAHAGIAIEEGRSAILAMSKAIAEIGVGRKNDVTVNIGVVSGGKAMNIVADDAEFLGEVRSHDRASAERELARIEACVRRASEETGVIGTLESELMYGGYRYAQDDPFIRELVSWFATIGVEPRFQESYGGSDANILADKGIKAVTVGIGCGSPHATDEWADLDQLTTLARVIEVGLTRQEA